MLYSAKLGKLARLSEVASRLYTKAPCLSGITCLLFVSLRILHIDQNLTTASFQSFHSEHCWLQHLVAMRLNTCNVNTDTQNDRLPKKYLNVY